MTEERDKPKHHVEFEDKNRHLQMLPTDHLFNLGLSTRQNLIEMFSGVRIVCLAGPAPQVRRFAAYMKTFWNYGNELNDLGLNGQHFSMYKTGPVLTVSHGIGAASLNVCLQEVFKLLDYARLLAVEIIRMGTSGGIGIPAGTVVISTGAINDLFEEAHRFHVLGRAYKVKCAFNAEMVRKLIFVAENTYPEIPMAAGKTMSASDFYESQARLDGAFASFEEEEKFEFLRKAQDRGVKNIDMEGTLLAAMCARVKIPCANVCVTLLDRLQTDQIVADRALIEEWENRPARIVSAYLMQRLTNSIPPNFVIKTQEAANLGV